MTTTTSTATRRPDHLVVSFTSTSGVVHAAHDCVRRHVLACNGRAIAGAAFAGDATAVTCTSCRTALATGKAEWAS